MTTSWCDRLDDFFNLELSEAERSAFGDHLDTCRACSQAVREQEELNEQLRQAVIRLNPVPDSLAARIERRIHGTARRRFWGRTAALAAAVVLLCVGLWWFPRPSTTAVSEVPSPVHRTPPLRTAPLDPRSLVRVTFDRESSVIAVPVRSQSPNVTIVWVYSTVERPDPVAVELPEMPERNEP